MNIVMNGPVLVLERLQRISLIDGAGTTAHVMSGCVWITMEHDRRDIVLADGDTWVIERDGLTLLHAEELSMLVLTYTPANATRPARVLRKCMRAIARAIGPYSRRVLPYY